MKTKILLLSMGLLTAGSITAQDPKVVTWEALQNPLTSGDGLAMSASGQLIWGDYNNDGYIDAFMIAGQGDAVSRLYKNNGNGTFTEIETDVLPLSLSSALFIDIDNDGCLDLVTIGSHSGDATMAETIFYRNSGAPNYEFIEDESLVKDALDNIAHVSTESTDNGGRLLVAFDYDNDGWMDLLINGSVGEGLFDPLDAGRVVALYRNNKGVLELQTTPVNGTENFRGVTGGSVHAGDINNDGYADLIISGYDDNEGSVTDLYINNGNGTFSKWENSQSVFTGHNQGETFFVDVNNDGWLDIIEIGRNTNDNWNNFAKVYISEEGNSFTTLGEEVTNLFGGGAVIAAGDINNDGFMDFFAAGWGTNSTFFYNKGDNSFMPIDAPDDVRSRSGCADFADINNDNNLDFSIFGYRDGNDGNQWPNNFLINKLGDGIVTNTPPTAPTGLKLGFENGTYTLSWTAATDDITPTEALRYNVYVKYADGKTYSYVPADLNTGRLKVGGMPAMITTKSIKLNLPEGAYTFGVQAIDQANAGGAFATIPSSAVGIQSHTSLEEVQVSVSGKAIRIENSYDQAISYNVVSVNGSSVVSGACAGSSVETVALNNGVYIVNLVMGNESKVVKVIIL